MQCQKLDPEHDTASHDANVRKVVYRGGELLQAIFYTFREEAFPTHIREVKTEGGRLIICKPASGQILQPKLSKWPRYKFPSYSVSDESTKAALLTFECTSIPAGIHKPIPCFGLMHEVTEKVLGGISA